MEALKIYTREPDGEWTMVGDRLNVLPNNLVHHVAQAEDLEIRAEA